MESLSKVVRDILLANIATRDDDSLLATEVWKQQLKEEGFNVQNMQTITFFKIYQSGVLSNHDTITRCRRLIQEKEPSLRGYNYLKRQSNQKVVKEKIKILKQNLRPIQVISSQMSIF